MNDCPNNMNNVIANGVFFRRWNHEVIKFQNFEMKTIQTHRCWWRSTTMIDEMKERSDLFFAFVILRHQIIKFHRDFSLTPWWRNRLRRMTILKFETTSLVHCVVKNLQWRFFFRLDQSMTTKKKESLTNLFFSGVFQLIIEWNFDWQEQSRRIWHNDDDEEELMTSWHR